MPGLSLKTLKSPRTSYFEWVRGPGAVHTSCPFSSVFFSCLISNPSGTPCLRGAQQLYIGLALCRQYNDYGSLARDQAEGNLNSLNFPEFSGSEEERGQYFGLTLGPMMQSKQGQGDDGMDAAAESSTSRAQAEKLASAKADLMQAAEFERECMELSMKKLEQLWKSDGTPNSRFATEAMRAFVNVTDLYGQIYVAKDIASRMK